VAESLFAQRKPCINILRLFVSLEKALNRPEAVQGLREWTISIERGETLLHQDEEFILSSKA
jgi:hypothetical protein